MGPDTTATSSGGSSSGLCGASHDTSYIHTYIYTLYIYIFMYKEIHIFTGESRPVDRQKSREECAEGGVDLVLGPDTTATSSGGSSRGLCGASSDTSFGHRPVFADSSRELCDAWKCKPGTSRWKEGASFVPLTRLTTTQAHACVVVVLVTDFPWRCVIRGYTTPPLEDFSLQGHQLRTQSCVCRFESGTVCSNLWRCTSGTSSDTSIEKY